MPEKLEFQDLFDYIAVELGRPSGDLRDLAYSKDNGIDQILKLLSDKNYDANPILVADPIRHPKMDAPLVAGGIELSQNRIKMLLHKQVAEPTLVLGPINLKFCEKALARFRTSIKSQFKHLAKLVMSERTGAGKNLHSAIARHPLLENIEGQFSQVVDVLTESPQAVASIVRIIPNGHKGNVASLVDASLLSMAVLTLRSVETKIPVSHQELMDLGTAALLMDMSYALKGKPDEKHIVESARMAAFMGASKKVIELILVHHKLKDASGLPIFKSPNKPEPAEAVMISINVFMSEMREQAPDQALQLVKNLKYLAQEGFIDPVSMSILARLTLPKLQVVILEKADEIKRNCPKGESYPIMWPVAGNKTPTLFLCQNSECEHRSAQVSLLSTDVPISANGRVISKIRRGEYFTCVLCTEKLKELYRLVEEHLKKQQG